MSIVESIAKSSTGDIGAQLNQGSAGHLRLDAEHAAELIGRLPAHDVLNARELLHWQGRERSKGPIAGQHPSTVLHRNLAFVLKVTRLCNLRCRYCRSWAEGPGQVMSFPVMLEAIWQALSLPNARSVDFVLHGGEATLLKARTLEKIVWLQQQLKRPHQRVRNCLQTNAVNLSDEWIELLKFLGIPVGISLDGPPELNGERIDKQGRPTSGRVAHTIQKLDEAGLLFGGLVVVTPLTAAFDIGAMFEYFVSIGLRNIDFLNVLPDNADLPRERACSHYISFDRYVIFLCEAFRVWSSDYTDSLHISIFADLLKAVAGAGGAKSCLWSGNCMTRIFTVEANGDVGACDKFVGLSNFTYGNILRASLDDLVASSSLVTDMVAQQAKHRASTSTCEWKAVCHGGCPHDQFLDRLMRSADRQECCGLSPLLNAMKAAIDRDRDLLSSLLGNNRPISQGALHRQRPLQEVDNERVEYVAV